MFLLTAFVVSGNVLDVHYAMLIKGRKDLSLPVESDNSGKMGRVVTERFRIFVTLLVAFLWTDAFDQLLVDENVSQLRKIRKWAGMSLE